MDGASTVKESVILKTSFIISELVLLFAVSIFKTRKVMLFFGLHFLLLTVFEFKKNKLVIPFLNRVSTVCASFASIIVFNDFYLNSVSIKPRSLVSAVGLLQKLIPFSYEQYISIISLTIGLLSFYSLYIFSDLIAKNAYVFIEAAKMYRKHFIGLFTIYLFAFLSMFRANYYYIDDLGRAVRGNGMTGGFSRYLSDVFAEVLHLNIWLTDISPITQIIALLIMAYTGIIILYLIHDENPPKLFHIAALVPIGLSPYFLSCLSFKYDAPYMAFSAFISIAPLLFRKEEKWKYGIAVYTAILCMCTTYQGSAGVFPVCVILLAFLMWYKQESLKSVIEFIGVSILGYMSALISFRFILMAPTPADYVNTRISFGHCFTNISQYLQTLGNDYSAIWKLCVFIIVAVFSIHIIIFTRRSRVMTTALLIAVLMSILILSYGVNTVFESPTLDARGIYAIGITVSIVSVITLSLDKKLLSASAVVILAWQCLVFATIYGNVLDLQKNYTVYRMEQVLDDINGEQLLLNKEANNCELQFAGTEGTSNAVTNISKEYPILKRLVPVLFDSSQDYYWGPMQLCGFYEERLKGINIIYKRDYNLDEYELIKETTNHSIYCKDNSILVLLNSKF